MLAQTKRFAEHSLDPIPHDGVAIFSGDRDAEPGNGEAIFAGVNDEPTVRRRFLPIIGPFELGRGLDLLASGQAEPNGGNDYFHGTLARGSNLARSANCFNSSFASSSRLVGGTILKTRY